MVTVRENRLCQPDAKFGNTIPRRDTHRHEPSRNIGAVFHDNPPITVAARVTQKTADLTSRSSQRITPYYRVFNEGTFEGVPLFC